MPIVAASRLDIAYERSGSGPPLILLHGATGSGQDHFAPVLPAAEELVLAPDARGHAGTRWDVDAGWTAADLVDDVEAFADALGLATFHLFGYSMGAMTALELSPPDRRPRLRTLVVVSITTEREPRLSGRTPAHGSGRVERDDPIWAAQLAAGTTRSG